MLAGVVLTGDKAEAREVLLEPKTEPGPDPYTPPLDPEPAQQETPIPPPPPASKAATTKVNVGGKDVPLYGGSGQLSTCDKQKLVAFLGTDSAKGSAWAQVLGIQAANIPSYIGGLAEVTLNVDTRVTNHGFKGAKATPRQSVLQAGTAVLVDSEGTPRVRCKCGNPLLPPETVGGTPKYVGQKWPEFQPTALAAPPGTDLGSEQPTPGVQTSAPAGNLIKDGGFEAGIGVWSVLTGNANAQATIVSDEVHGGTNALRIVNQTPVASGAAARMSQLLSVTKGAQHCLKFFAKIQDAEPGALLFAVDAAGSNRIGLPPGTLDWNQYSKTFTAESDQNAIQIITQGMGTAWVDDITVTQGPC